ncbi:hypothetical protein QQ045_013044 [Rhodiola kirilowii]
MTDETKNKSHGSISSSDCGSLFIQQKAPMYNAQVVAEVRDQIPAKHSQFYDSISFIFRSISFIIRALDLIMRSDGSYNGGGGEFAHCSNHDVVCVSKIQKVMDISGVQTYVINRARVLFLNERPQSKAGIGVTRAVYSITWQLPDYLQTLAASE